MAENRDWLRVRGLGRERFAGYFEEYLRTLGYAVERTDTADPAETRLSAKLVRMNPAVPGSARELAFRLYPTSGGSAVVWEGPVTIVEADRVRLERLVRELQSHLERAILTESHATAKVAPPAAPRLPWQKPPDP